MAGLLNPYYGTVPGAPYGLHQWLGNQFVLADMLPPPPPPPPPPLAPVVTPQDIETHQAATALSGSAPSGGDNGAGGLERNAGFADPTRAYGGVDQSGGSKNGINSWGSTLGNIGSIAGFAIPGIGGMALGPIGNIAGSWIDANNANRGLISQGLPGNVNALPAALSNGLFGLLGRAGIGQSIADQVGGVKNAAAAAMPTAPTPSAPAIWGGILGDWAGTTKDYVGGGGDASGTSGVSGDKGAPDKGVDSGYGADAWSGGTGGTSSWYAKGGTVRPPEMGMMDPPGPDDQMAGLQTGEGVLTKAAMKRYPGLLDALNKGNTKRARGLLGK